MPRKPLKPKIRRGLPSFWRTQIDTGSLFFQSDIPLSRNELKQIWKERREDIMESYITRFPGRRPWAYYEFERGGWKFQNPNDEIISLMREGILSHSEIEAIAKKARLDYYFRCHYLRKEKELPLPIKRVLDEKLDQDKSEFPFLRTDAKEIMKSWRQ
jgi:hypothetical protein